MPELPEVETIRSQLEPRIVGRRLVGVDVFWQRAVHDLSIEALQSGLAGRRIAAVHRRGKYLLIRLSDGCTLILHLKMSGVLLLRPSGEEPHPHTTAVLRLDDGIDLHFIDQRKFGSIWLVSDEKDIIGQLGPEPLEKAFTPAMLGKIAGRHRIPIKALLFDQNAIAGIGNMWADEALFTARIHPTKPSCTLNSDEIGRLHQAIVSVLERGIRHNGASTSTYRLPDGSSGTAHSEFQVAHRRGEKCFTCGTQLVTIKVRQRGTYFCPNCQPER